MLQIILAGVIVISLIFGDLSLLAPSPDVAQMRLGQFWELIPSPCHIPVNWLHFNTRPLLDGTQALDICKD